PNAKVDPEQRIVIDGSANKLLDGFLILANAGSGTPGQGTSIFGVTISHFDIFGIKIDDSANNTIGRATNKDLVAKERTVIQDTADEGVLITGAKSTGNRIINSYIGTDLAGRDPAPNGHNGVSITKGASSNTIGVLSPLERNVISGNDWNGVAIYSGTN